MDPEEGATTVDAAPVVAPPHIRAPSTVATTSDDDAVRRAAAGEPLASGDEGGDVETGSVAAADPPTQTQQQAQEGAEQQQQQTQQPDLLHDAAAQEPGSAHDEALSGEDMVKAAVTVAAEGEPTMTEATNNQEQPQPQPQPQDQRDQSVPDKPDKPAAAPDPLAAQTARCTERRLALTRHREQHQQLRQRAVAAAAALASQLHGSECEGWREAATSWVQGDHWQTLCEGECVLAPPFCPACLPVFIERIP
jgi:hypothetical protein